MEKKSCWFCSKRDCPTAFLASLKHVRLYQFHSDSPGLSGFVKPIRERKSEFFWLQSLCNCRVCVVHRIRTNGICLPWLSVRIWPKSKLGPRCIILMGIPNLEQSDNAVYCWPGLVSGGPLDVAVEWPGVHPNSLAFNAAAEGGSSESMGRSWYSTPQLPPGMTHQTRHLLAESLTSAVPPHAGFLNLPPGNADGHPLVNFSASAAPPYAETPPSFRESGNLVEAMPGPPPPVRSKKRGGLLCTQHIQNPVLDDAKIYELADVLFLPRA
jgi:hypothetical protein